MESVNFETNVNNFAPEQMKVAKIDHLSTCDEVGSNSEAAVSSDALRNPMILPRYGDAIDVPDHVKIDCSGEDMTQASDKLLSAAKKCYKDHGAVLLTNTGLEDITQMEDWCVGIMENKMKYEGGANSRRTLDDKVAKNVYDTGAPSSAHLHYHHEMAYIPKSVRMLGFCCIKDTPGKGATWISDQKACTKHLLQTELGKKLKEKGLCYVRCLTDKKAYEGGEKTWNGIDEIGVYNHWQQSFGVQTREECEEKLKQLGPQFQWTWGENNYLVTRFYVDAYENLESENLNYLYASVADDSLWFDQWHGVSHLPTMEEPHNATAAQRPLKLTYGDMTEFTRKELEEFVEVYDKFGYPINWQKGDIAVICNYRWAHGRPEYHLDDGEERQLGVILGQQYTRVGQSGEWPEP